MKKLSFLTTLLLSTSLFSQTTLILDANFESALVTLGYDNVVNGSVNTSSINTITNLNVSNANISNLTGIQDFTSLTTLNCSGNQLTNLNVNSLTNLLELKCHNNQLSSLNVSSLTALTWLEFTGNLLTTINVSTLSNLVNLRAENNNLTSLDVSNNVLLSAFNCSNNNLTNLNLGQINTLTYLNCNNNNLVSLNISNNTLLNQLFCNNNQLTSLNVKNGNNSNFTNFSATNNPLLVCINVDNESWAISNWSDNVDSQSNFSTNCSLGINESFNENITIYPNPTSNQLTVDLSEGLINQMYSIFDYSGRIIKQANIQKSTEQIDLSAFSTGIYYFKIENKNIQKMLIKQ